MNTPNLICCALVLLGQETAFSSDAFSGHRLFHSPAQRTDVRSDASVSEAETPVEGPVVDDRVDSPEDLKYVEKHRVVSFDGVVVRHDGAGDSSAVIWINGELQHPSAWDVERVSNYRHRTQALGRQVSLGVGNRRRVSVTRLMNPHR